jgi:hypothetical protein
VGDVHAVLDLVVSYSVHESREEGWVEEMGFQELYLFNYLSPHQHHHGRPEGMPNDPYVLSSSLANALLQILVIDSNI